jgi:hypothetical protein
MRTSVIDRSQAAMAALLLDLVGELFQTERSATLHCVREAKRYVEAPPALALREVADHARYALAELKAMTKAGEIPARPWSKVLGQTLGAGLSQLRETLLDRAIGTERSYRMTLLGIRHGVDLVRLVEYVALGAGKNDLAAWCSAWLAKREPLLERAADELIWFAENPSVARAAPRRLRSAPV